MANLEERIKEFPSGQVIGIVETMPNGDKIVRNFPGRQILGYYRAKYNHTTDFYGRVLATGDIAVSLIYKDRQ